VPKGRSQKRRCDVDRSFLAGELEVPDGCGVLASLLLSLYQPLRSLWHVVKWKESVWSTAARQLASCGGSRCGCSDRVMIQDRMQTRVEGQRRISMSESLS